MWSMTDMVFKLQAWGRPTFRPVTGTGYRWLLASFLCQWGWREPKIEASQKVTADNKDLKTEGWGAGDGQHWVGSDKCLSFCTEA